jgi:hypothetical protein
MPKCPSCQREIDPNATKCPYCQTTIDNMNPVIKIILFIIMIIVLYKATMWYVKWQGDKEVKRVEEKYK